MFSRLMNSIKGRQFGAGNKRTICELHRQIYDILVTELAESRPDVLEKVCPILDEAFILGVKVTDKLIQYKLSPQQTWLKQPTNIKEATRLRKLRIELIEILKGEE
jgi:hypothetical protein